MLRWVSLGLGWLGTVVIVLRVYWLRSLPPRGQYYYKALPSLPDVGPVVRLAWLVVVISVAGFLASWAVRGAPTYQVAARCAGVGLLLVVLGEWYWASRPAVTTYGAMTLVRDEVISRLQWNAFFIVGACGVLLVAASRPGPILPPYEDS